MKRFPIVFSTLILLALLSCAASTRISDIRQTPRRFHNKKVTISGVVDKTITFPVLNVGVYQIDDGTGKIWVKPKNKIPFKGDRVVVSGVIKVGISISGKSFGIILIEEPESEEPY